MTLILMIFIITNSVSRTRAWFLYEISATFNLPRTLITYWWVLLPQQFTCCNIWVTAWHIASPQPVLYFSLSSLPIGIFSASSPKSTSRKGSVFLTESSIISTRFRRCCKVICSFLNEHVVVRQCRPRPRRVGADLLSLCQPPHGSQPPHFPPDWSRWF